MTKVGFPDFGDQAQRPQRDADRHHPELQREREDEFGTATT
jgi:hypothetical protein